jgi:hypothetical protein
MLNAKFVLFCCGATALVAFAAGFFEGRLYEQYRLFSDSEYLRRFKSRVDSLWDDP